MSLFDINSSSCASIYYNCPDLLGHSSFSAASPCPLSARGAEIEAGPCGRRGCDVSDPGSGCHRDQLAKEWQCLAGGAEALDVLQPPVELLLLMALCGWANAVVSQGA